MQSKNIEEELKTKLPAHVEGSEEFNNAAEQEKQLNELIQQLQGLNMSDRTSKVTSSPASTIESVLRRLQTSQLPKGAQGTPADLGVVRNTVNGLGQTTLCPIFRNPV